MLCRNPRVYVLSGIKQGEALDQLICNAKKALREQVLCRRPVYFFPSSALSMTCSRQMIGVAEKEAG